MKNIFKTILAVVALSLLSVSAFAQGAGNVNAIKLDKTAEPNGDGTYTLTLESYITGYLSNSTYTTISNTPLDIVLLLDVSGSMNQNMAGQNTSTDADRRINILKQAVKNFISSIQANAQQSGTDHRISLIKFSASSYPSNTATGYSAISSASYTYDSYGTSTRYYLYNGTYCPVTRQRTGSNNRNYRYNLYFTYNNQTYYLTGTGNGDVNVTTNQSSAEVTGNGTKIWEGVLYQTNAAIPGSIVVGNQSGRTQVVKDFTVVNSAGASSLSTATDGLVANGSTYVNYGMELAKLVFNNARQDAAKLLVLFTDGVPGAYQGLQYFDSNVANAAIASSKILKDNGVKVYTIGTFTETNDNVNNYMNFVSSNYPDATSLSTGGSPLPNEEDRRYFANVTSSEALNNVFQTISEDAADSAGAGAEYVAEESSITIKDIVTENFTIPNGADDIEFFISTPTSITTGTYAEGEVPTYGDINWSVPVAAPDVYIDGEEPSSSSDGTTTVSIKGFDFSANWVGFTDRYEEHERTQHDIHGSKLIIKIVIAPDPAKVGGLVATNASGSGFYVGDQKIKDFVNPDPVIVPSDIMITLGDSISLVKDGESFLFDIYEGEITPTSSPILTVALTYHEGQNSATITKLDMGTVEHPKTYTVVPKETWSYKYDMYAHGSSIDKSVSKPVLTTNESGKVILDNEFIFDLRKRGDYYKTRGDEAGENNVFNPVNTPRSSTR